jgi:hypothetical protein
MLGIVSLASHAKVTTLSDGLFFFGNSDVIGGNVLNINGIRS